MSPIAVTALVFLCVFSGALLGIFLHSHLPEGHLDSNSKDAVRLAMGLVATTLALVLGLLIASAKGFYDTQNSEVTQAAADVVLLNRILVHYGPETKEARAQLRSTVVKMADLSWQRDQSDQSHFNSPAVGNESLFDKIQELSPRDDNQRLLQAQAVSIAIRLGESHWLMFAQKSSSVPTPLLAILVFWLTLLFVSFGLFVRANVTVIASLFVSALAVCGAIFLILEMYQPYSGLIQVSGAPLHAALTQLGQ